MRQKLNGGGLEQVSHVVDLRFKICQKWPNFAILEAIWVPRMSVERCMCIGTNLDDEQTHLITLQCLSHFTSGLKDLFVGPKYRKIGLEKHPFCKLFQVPASCFVFDSHGLVLAPLW